MPTTCGYPNCKFRSRYRGSDDNRHFYRVPKKPQVLRDRWLEAIGRTEQTIVSQLRVCSGHFHGGEKHEGDVPVADPTVDAPVKVDLPPKSTKNSCERRHKRKNISEKLVMANSSRSSTTSGCGFQQDVGSDGSPINAAISESGGVSSTTHIGEAIVPVATTPTNCNSPSSPVVQVLPSILNNNCRPLVALLDGRDCSVEMPILKDHATVAFCDAMSVQEVHEKVLNEAVAALTWNSFYLGVEELSRFKRLTHLVQIGPGSERVDLKAARKLGITVSSITGSCIEETADSTLCLILNFYRKTFFLANNYVKDSNGAISVDRMSELAAGATRIRGQTLGLLGFGRVGTAVAIRARAFGFSIVVYDPYITEGFETSFGISRVTSIEELVAVSDCLSLHCSINSSTNKIINEKALKNIKKSGLFLVNTCSADIMDLLAIADALQDGKLRGVAMDFIDSYTCNLENGPLKDCPNVVVTPGSSFFSIQSSVELREQAAEEVRRGLVGFIPSNLKHTVNVDLDANKNVITDHIYLPEHRNGDGSKRMHMTHPSKRNSDENEVTMSNSLVPLNNQRLSDNPLINITSNASDIHMNFGFLDSLSHRGFGTFVIPGNSFNAIHTGSISSVNSLQFDNFKKDILL